MDSGQYESNVGNIFGSKKTNVGHQPFFQHYKCCSIGRVYNLQGEYSSTHKNQQDTKKLYTGMLLDGNLYFSSIIFLTCHFLSFQLKISPLDKYSPILSFQQKFQQNM